MRMMLRVAAVLAMLAAGGGFTAPAGAQTSGSNSGSPSSGSTGTTSGPAAGSRTTLGTGGVTPATPHQADTVRNGTAKQGEKHGQTGGTEIVKPGASDAGSGVTPPRH